MGVGYICVTNQNLRMVCSGKLGEAFEKIIISNKGNLISRFFEPVRELLDKTTVSAIDQYWTIPNSSIRDAQILADEFLIDKDPLLFIAIPLVTYEVYAHSRFMEEMSTALNMAMTGKFSEIWLRDTRFLSQAIELAKQASSQPLVVV